jgi:DNA-directed RNA polymerase specialized sigma24 family protein
MPTSMPTTTIPKLPLDAADEPRFAGYRRLLEHPRVLEYLQGRLVGLELQDADGEDLVGQTYEALWRRRTDDDPPNNLPRLLALARTVFQGKLVDFFRHKAVVQARIKDAPLPRGEKLEPGQCSGRDQLNYVEELRPPRSITPEMTLQAKQQLEFTNRVADKVGLTDDDVETMQAIDCDELTIEKAAALRGMEPGALRVRLHRIRKRINEAWRKHNLIRTPTGLVILLLLLLLTYAIALGIARRNDPPPPHPPQRTLQPRQPRGEVPTNLAWPGDDAKTP